MCAKQKTYVETMAFEAEVRSTAEAIWGLEPGDCQPEHYSDNPKIRELDGIAKVNETTHLIMVTVSTKLDKVKRDVKKLNAAEKIEEKSALAVIKWFITEVQLDAQHINHCKQNNVTPLTLDQFKKRYFDGREYISKRKNHPFGSARNPFDDSVTIDDKLYVSLPITEEYYAGGKKNTRPINVNDIVKRLASGEHFVLIAPFGAGKSITTREIHNKLNTQYLKGETDKVAVTLNLREHWKQEYYDLVLERHAKGLGIKKKESLVMAWRASLAHLLMDGFDEVSAQYISRSDDKNFMKEARREALVFVKDFLTKIPANVGVFICGRDHYFDGLKELEHAVGLTGKTYSVLRLSEFSEESAKTYLKKNGFGGELPLWLPRKPLILSYLIKNNLIQEIVGIDYSKGYGYAWDEFLSKISEREAALEKAAMDADTVRAVMEHIAWTVRGRISGTGPITGSDLSAAYRSVTGQPAGDAVLAQLQRLPGLSQRNEDPGARGFIDDDMLCSLQGSALAKFLFGDQSFLKNPVLHSLKQKSLSVAAHLLTNNNFNMSTVVSIANRLISDAYSDGWSENKIQVASDCALLALEMASQSGEQHIDFNGLEIVGADVGRIDLEEQVINGLTFKKCTIGELLIGPDYAKSSISILDSDIGKVLGVSNESRLPKNICVNCEIMEYANTETTSAIMSLTIEDGAKALLTVLKKLFKQSGGGRRRNAFARGITDRNVLEKIDDAVTLLHRYGFVTSTKDVVHPIRSKCSEVDEIMSAPLLSDAEIIKEARGL